MIEKIENSSLLPHSVDNSRLSILILCVVIIGCSERDETPDSNVDARALAMTNSAVAVMNAAFKDTSLGRERAINDSIRQDSTIKLLDSALSINPNYKYALLNKVSYLSHFQRYRESLNALERLMKIEDRPSGSLSLKGHLLIKLGRFEEARRIYRDDLRETRRLTEEHPNNLDYRIFYVYALLFAGGKEAALLELEKTEQKFPNNAKVNEHKALIRDIDFDTFYESL